MSRKNSVHKTAWSVLISAMMALPAPAMAREESTSAAPAVTEDSPVLVQTFDIDGQQATAFIGTVTADREAAFVSDLVRNRPENTILLASGPDDPALKAAAKTGWLKSLKTFIVGQPEDAPMVNPSAEDVAAVSSFRGFLLQKLRSITRAAKSDTAVGIYFGLTYAGIQGGFTTYASSSVSSGAVVFAMYALWNTFILTKEKHWGRVLDRGGEAAIKVGGKIASLVGTEMSERDKRIYEVVGKFATSWAVGATQSGVVKGLSGDFQELQGLAGLAEGFLDAAKSGVQGNYNIWDAAVLKNNAENGYFTEKRTKWYFRAQMVIGAILESMAFRGVPYTGLFLTTVVGAGAVYLALNPEKQVALHRTALKFNVSFRSGVAYISNPEIRQHRRLAAINLNHGCWQALSTRRSGAHYEDVQ